MSVIAVPVQKQSTAKAKTASYKYPEWKAQSTSAPAEFLE